MDRVRLLDRCGSEFQMVRAPEVLEDSHSRAGIARSEGVNLGDLCTFCERAAPDAPERIYRWKCCTRTLPSNVLRRIARERVPETSQQPLDTRKHGIDNLSHVRNAEREINHY